MQVGISTASLFPRVATEDALDAIISLGADCAEVFFSTFYEYRPEFSKSVAGRLNGFAVNSVHVNGLNFEGNFFNPSRRVRGDGMYWLDQLLRSAQLLGCKNYTFHGFHRSGSGGGAGWDEIASRLAEVVYFAQAIITNTYEPMYPYLITAIMYLILVLIFTWLQGKMERRLRQSDRR